MKITDAYWEERNLGLKVCELIFEPGEIINHDKISEIEKSFDYVIAKIPGDSILQMHTLEETGYRYLENQQVIYFRTDQLKNINGLWKNRFPDIHCARVLDEDILEKICEKIKSGLYLKGRISADPLLQEGVSDIRIVNWLKDLYVRKDATVYVIEKKIDPVGYFVLEKIDNAHLNIVQAGVFNEFQNKGYSFLLLFNIVKTAFENNFTGIFASVSANNIKTMNSISKFVNFSVRETYIVARKMIHHKLNND